MSACTFEFLHLTTHVANNNVQIMHGSEKACMKVSDYFFELQLLRRPAYTEQDI